MLDALENGEIGYGVVVPEHFADKVASGSEAVWELYPGQNADLNLVAESVIGGLLERINFVQSAAIALGNPQAAEAAAAGASAAEGSYVNVTAPDMSGRDYSALQYYAAQMLVMFLLYAGMAAGLSIVEEREARTMDRIHAAPVKPVHVLIGKIAGNSLVAFGQALVIIVFTLAFYGLEWGSRYVHLLAACVFTVAAAVSLAVIVAALTPKAKTFQMIFMTLTMVMTFLSGGFTPDLGGFLERLGEFTLSYWASQSFIQLMLNSADSIVQEHLTVLGLTAAGLFLISALLGGKAVSHE
jgi:ABC-type multidrug transport system, permease component